MTTGRPSLYKPEYCEMVVELGKQGKSPAQIASALEVNRQTLNNWAGEHDDFLAALTRAKVEEQTWWENVGQAALTADKFQSAVWAKSMQARFREDYTERRENEHFGKGGGPIKGETTIVTGVERAGDT